MHHTSGNLSEDVVKSVGNDASELCWLLLPLHGESLPTPCLPIRKDGPCTHDVRHVLDPLTALSRPDDMLQTCLSLQVNVQYHCIR